MKKEEITGLFDVTGKVAVIIGGAGGLGSTCARGLAAAGAKVMCVDIATDKLKEVVEGIKKDGGEAAFSTCDITNHDAVKGAVKETVDTFGGIDILVAASGVNWFGPIVEQPFEQWQKEYEINVNGPYLFCKEAGKVMIEQGRGGKVIFIGSVRGSQGLGDRSAYCSTKAAIHLLTKTLGCEWGKHNINVNCIAPSVFRSEITKFVFENEAIRKEVLARIPMGRLGEPEDFIGTLILLSAKASDWITGAILYVDGGYMAT
ncbi:SDR family oxidoreductase [Deltaproteobacteria bacterium]|nr:SDR family oxidoreductase [Deltaproteobacteria bacterium]